MFWMFFMFVLFEPFLNYVSASGAFDAVCQLMQPLIDVGGEVAFLMLSAAVGIFGISGTGVAQAQIIHELFLPMVQSLNIAMPIWGMVVLVGCQVTFFVTPPLIWWDRWAWPAPRTSSHAGQRLGHHCHHLRLCPHPRHFVHHVNGI